jgi:hypothetical protein
MLRAIDSISRRAPGSGCQSRPADWKRADALPDSAIAATVSATAKVGSPTASSDRCSPDASFARCRIRAYTDIDCA